MEEEEDDEEEEGVTTNSLCSSSSDCRPPNLHHRHHRHHRHRIIVSSTGDDSLRRRRYYGRRMRRCGSIWSDRLRCVFTGYKEEVIARLSYDCYWRWSCSGEVFMTIASSCRCFLSMLFALALHLFALLLVHHAFRLVLFSDRMTFCMSFDLLIGDTDCSRFVCHALAFCSVLFFFVMLFYSSDPNNSICIRIVALLPPSSLSLFLLFQWFIIICFFPVVLFIYSSIRLGKLLFFCANLVFSYVHRAWLFLNSSQMLCSF